MVVNSRFEDAPTGPLPEHNFLEIISSAYELGVRSRQIQTLRAFWCIAGQHLDSWFRNGGFEVVHGCESQLERR